MRKLVSFMHVSLDGFVAGPSGEMDWIHVDDELFDYAGDRTNASDMALYGRNTFEMMEGYWPTAGDQPNASKHDREHSAWYSKVNKIVASISMKGQSLPNATIISDQFAEKIKEIREQGEKEIIIFGSPSVSHALTQADQIDDYWLFINPVLIGKGIPMFKGIEDIKKLKLVKSHVFSSGVVCVHYTRA